ncbi:TfuA-related McrA-glycine thioamidation protein [Rhodococcus sp. A14]|nr:TfuA-related McrA-glycine thioamidation protein [Rhodococcus sp. A14]
MSLVLFAGPSLCGFDEGDLPYDVELRPPARRGSFDRLSVESGPDVAIALADGFFQSVPAVGHHEIIEVLRSGRQVWGLCSIGAIRAAELDHLGMMGFGEIYESFRCNPEQPDDVVALLHDPEWPWRPVSEPLVHLSRASSHLVEIGLIDQLVADAVIASLKNRWFGERTIGEFLKLLENRIGRSVGSRSAIDHFDDFRTKHHDLVRFLDEAPWRV